jgi:hypothetical protein
MEEAEGKELEDCDTLAEVVEAGEGSHKDEWTSTGSATLARLKRAARGREKGGSFLADSLVSRAEQSHKATGAAHCRLVHALDWLVVRDGSARVTVAGMLPSLLREGVVSVSLARCVLRWDARFGASLPEFSACARFVRERFGSEIEQEERNPARDRLREQFWKVDELEREAHEAEDAVRQAVRQGEKEEEKEELEWEDVFPSHEPPTARAESQVQQQRDAVAYVERRLLTEADWLLSLAWHSGERRVHERITECKLRLASLLERVSHGEGVHNFANQHWPESDAGKQDYVDVQLDAMTAQRSAAKLQKRKRQRQTGAARAQESRKRRRKPTHNECVLTELAAPAQDEERDASQRQERNHQRSKADAGKTQSKSKQPQSVRSQLMKKLKMPKRNDE